MLVRQLSNREGEELSCFCLDSDRKLGSLIPGERHVEDLKLGCGCCVHYDCLLGYLRYKIGDRMGMDLRGMACPYGSACKFWLNPANYEQGDAAAAELSTTRVMLGASLDADAPLATAPPAPPASASASVSADELGPVLLPPPAPDAAAAIPNAVAAVAGGGSSRASRGEQLERQWSLSSRVYFITTQDLEEIRVYGEVHAEALAGLECKALGQQELDNFCAWIEESRSSVGPASVPETTDPYVLATSKGCPRCGFRSTHYHRHHCHHISRNEGLGKKYKGCPNCATEYCYKCLSPDVENERERGSKEHCRCAEGCWTSFCSPLDTPDDIEKYLRVDPVPRDIRCGCVLCGECKPGKPCAECTGCSVCQGTLNPGPLDLETPWVPPNLSMIKVFSAAKGEGPEKLRAAIAAAGDAFNPNAMYRGSTLLATLCRRARADDRESLGVLLAAPSSKGALNVNLVGDDGVSGLQASVTADFQHGIDALLEREGIDVNAALVASPSRSTSNPVPKVPLSTPLLAAISKGKDSTMAKLLRHPSVDPNLSVPQVLMDEEQFALEGGLKITGSSPLLLCVQGLYKGTLRMSEGVRLLCEHPRLQPELLSPQGSPILLAMLKSAASKAHQESLAPLLALLAPDLRAEPPPPRWAKYLAYERFLQLRDAQDKGPALEALQQAGDLVNAPDADGCRPLLFAVRLLRRSRKAEEEAADCAFFGAVLAIPGIDVNGPGNASSFSMSPLMEASSICIPPACLQLLIDAPGVHELGLGDPVNGKSALTSAIEGSRSANVAPCVSILLACHAAGREVGLNKLSRTLRSPLMYAVRAGLVDIVDKLVLAGADVNLAGLESKAAIIYALESTKKDRLPVLDRLIAAGLDPTLYDDSGRTALSTALHASKSGPPVETIAKLVALAPGASIAQPDRGGDTPGYTLLHKAVTLQKSPELVKVLLDSGKDVGINALTDEGKTALHCACRDALPEVVDLLLAHPHVDANAKTGRGSDKRPLEVAISFQSSSNSERMLRVIDALAAFPGTDLTSPTADGPTLLTIAASKGLVSLVDAILKVPSAVVDGAALQAAGKKGLDLAFAAMLDHLPTSGEDVAGAIINGRPDKDEASLFAFIVKCQASDDEVSVRMMQKIISHPAFDPNAVDALGNSPLHHLCEQRFNNAARHNAATLSALLWRGADTNTRNLAGQSPLDLALIASSGGVGNILDVEVLIMHPPFDVSAPGKSEQSQPQSQSYLAKAVANGAPAAVLKWLLERGASPNERSEVGGRSLLMDALLASERSRRSRRSSSSSSKRSTGGDTGSLELLMSLELTDWAATDDEGNCYLHYALRGGDAKVVQAMLHKGGFDCNALNAAGTSPLCAGILSDNAEAVEALLAWPALRCDDAAAVSAIITAACQVDMPQAVAHLLSRGVSVVDVVPKTTSGMEGPLLAHAIGSSPKIAKLLLSRDEGSEGSKGSVPDLSWRHQYGIGYLTLACKEVREAPEDKARAELLRLLLSKGCPAHSSECAGLLDICLDYACPEAVWDVL